MKVLSYQCLGDHLSQDPYQLHEGWAVGDPNALRLAQFKWDWGAQLSVTEWDEEFYQLASFILLMDHFLTEPTFLCCLHDYLRQVLTARPERPWRMLREVAHA